MEKCECVASCRCVHVSVSLCLYETFAVAKGLHVLHHNMCMRYAGKCITWMYTVAYRLYRRIHSQSYRWNGCVKIPCKRVHIHINLSIEQHRNWAGIWVCDGKEKNLPKAFTDLCVCVYLCIVCDVCSVCNMHTLWSLLYISSCSLLNHR